MADLDSSTVYGDLRVTKKILSEGKEVITKNSDTGAALMPSGPTSGRPSINPNGKFAYIRYNVEFGQWEGSPDGVLWSGLGGATGGPGNPAFYENDIVINQSYTITAGKNAGTFGPVEIANGTEVVIPTGSAWTIT